jgi:hypothetical protein
MILLKLVTPEPEPWNLRLRFQQLNERVLGRCREDDWRKENENMKDEICPTSLKMNSDKMMVLRKICVGRLYTVFPKTCFWGLKKPFSGLFFRKQYRFWGF